MVAQDTLLIHLNFNKPFDVHTSASKYQIGGVVSQEGKPLAYFSRNFNLTQLNYTITSKEMLGIVETLLGNEIKVYIGHKHLVYQNYDYARNRVLQQRLTIKEYGAEIIYIKEVNTVVSDQVTVVSCK